ncbi:uncharacterized protein BX663DRAFT_525373 [Cokeromyces recurvatus]|uniref:uncharacterized protein n=1 Tax=Cokeromyces recurvatus TaxID=90255 RepID=UPI00221EB1E0|nr:uncharacterized protein BX663DRAFT_525373 [Cokeromyces recurvatus]KAI7898304.1 hypothetical protein BX663DRAFT_525373 [Cokeromyces recurvatus]
MKRSIRTSIIAAIALIFFFFAYNVLQTNRLARTLSKDQNEQIIEYEPTQFIEVNPDEKFMSFFPHGDFTEQHEAVRNALRIAVETNRTLILPQLRLGKKHIPWAPFPILQKYYELQDRELLKSLCATNVKDWRLEYHSCDDLNEWIEVPWSTFFDLNVLRNQFKIRIYERTWGHGWGNKEAVLSHLGPFDVVALDPTSFPSNGSDWDTSKQQHAFSSNNRFFDTMRSLRSLNEVKFSLELKRPLKMLVTSRQLKNIKERYIQFGSLVYGLRFQTSTNKIQSELRKALRTNIFVTPNELPLVDEVANKVVSELGGARQFNMIRLNLKSLAMIELENQRSLKKIQAEIEGKPYVDFMIKSDMTGLELLKQLDHSIQTELMTSLVRELLGDMPIDQAITAASSVRNSILKQVLTITGLTDRESLLLACIDYKKNVDTKFPIYFLTNDIYDDVVAHPELFGPLLKVFPCTFSKKDMYNWGIIKPNWAKNALKGIKNINHESMLSPIVEILIARKSLSFFEVPTTKLTRLISWH